VDRVDSTNKGIPGKNSQCYCMTTWLRNGF
jgi:hypothetical protein